MEAGALVIAALALLLVAYQTHQSSRNAEKLVERLVAAYEPIPQVEALVAQETPQRARRRPVVTPGEDIGVRIPLTEDEEDQLYAQGRDEHIPRSMYTLDGEESDEDEDDVLSPEASLLLLQSLTAGAIISTDE